MPYVREVRRALDCRARARRAQVRQVRGGGGASGSSRRRSMLASSSAPAASSRNAAGAPTCGTASRAFPPFCARSSASAPRCHRGACSTMRSASARSVVQRRRLTQRSLPSWRRWGTERRHRSFAIGGKALRCARCGEEPTVERSDVIEDDCRLHPYVDITVRCRCGEMVRHRFAFADYAMRDMAGKALFQERALEKWNERALAVPSLARIMRMLKEHTVE